MRNFADIVLFIRSSGMFSGCTDIPYRLMAERTGDWKQWREAEPGELALRLAGRKDIDAAYVARQVEGWRRLRRKVPGWAAVDALEYPPRLALEQCSGETAARLKAEIVKSLFNPAENGGNTAENLIPESAESTAAVGRRGTLVDLTGGLGVDFSYMARAFARAVYVERQEELCRLARHNFPLLGLPGAEVVCADGTEMLRQLDAADVIYLDPARRDAAGRKTVHIGDCRPDVCALQGELRRKSRYVVVKLSPMLDIAEALGALDGVTEVHVVGAGGECKELLFVMRGERPGNPGPAAGEGRDGDFATRTEGSGAGAEAVITAHEGGRRFRFTLAEEAAARPACTDTPASYLYEPGAALMKAGAFGTVALRYGLEKLHPNTHLYTGDTLLADFPGRAFRIVAAYTFGKADLRRLRTECPRAGITVRNFPAAAAALRKRLKLADGGTQTLFAATTASGRHLLIRCERVN